MAPLWWSVSILLHAAAAAAVTPPPLPILPVPIYDQLEWQQREIIMFHHFGVNTFTDSEIGTGKEEPAVFNQWVETAVEFGVSLVLLTAKHHDGFCLWPSKYTNHSVVASPWKNSRGDVIREYGDAARSRGVDLGLYLSPWDRHDPRYGRDKPYNQYYLAQLQELLTNYGSSKEMWFDGHKEGPNAAKLTYYFEDMFSMVRQLQSSVIMFSDAGPDVRWVGDEHAIAGTTCWSTINRTSLTIGSEAIESYLYEGDPKGTDWVPPECNWSIRSGWFWHEYQSPRTLYQLIDRYYTSVGRNCVLLLNVPPNTTGLIPESDVLRLKEFRAALNEIFSTNLAENCWITASSQRGGEGGGFGPENAVDGEHLRTYWAPEDEYTEDPWIEMRSLGGRLRFNVVRNQEPIGLWQRIRSHEVYVDGKRMAMGTTVGYKRLHPVGNKSVLGYRVKIKITGSRALPLISSLGTNDTQDLNGFYFSSEVFHTSELHLTRRSMVLIVRKYVPVLFQDIELITTHYSDSLENNLSVSLVC